MTLKLCMCWYWQLSNLGNCSNNTFISTFRIRNAFSLLQMSDYSIHTVECRDLFSSKRCCVSSKGYKWKKAYNKMRRQKDITNDVHSVIWQNSKTTNHKNKTQLGTHECWPARNINHLKATVLRLHVYPFRGHYKSVCVFLFVCMGVWS